MPITVLISPEAPLGTIDAIFDNDPHPLDGKFEYDVTDINDDGRFEGGTASIPSTGRTYPLIDNIEAIGDDFYFTSGLIVGNDLGRIANVVDDDTAVLPKTPDANITVLNAKYKNAYIEFFENTATRDNTNTFVATLAWTASALAMKGQENADLVPAPDFWVACLVTCYQSHHNDSGDNATVADGDPDLQYHAHGTTWKTGESALTFGGTPTTTENVSTLYLETVQDFIAQVASGLWPGITPRPIAFMEPRVYAHEIGHQFGLPDVPLSAGTLMSPWDGTDKDFDAGEIAVIRDSTDLNSN